MNYKEETYVLNTLKELKERIRDMPNLNQLIKETHENNIMLKSICRYLATEAANASNENMEDFGRNILANMFSNMFDLNNIFNKK